VRSEYHATIDHNKNLRIDNFSSNTNLLIYLYSMLAIPELIGIANDEY
jgi:hypothetical protein